MPKGQPLPTFSSFLSRTKWAAAKYMLHKIGSKRHDIGFVYSGDQPATTSKTSMPLDDFHALSFVRRTLDFGGLGIVCSSATSPSIREVVLSAEFGPSSALIFGGSNYYIRLGFPEDDQTGESKSWSLRRSFAEPAEQGSETVQLRVLTPGLVIYPFQGQLAVVTHAPVYSKYGQALHSEGQASPLLVAEQRDVELEFAAISRVLTIDIAVVLDSEEILAYKWANEEVGFQESFFNAGVA
jgi:hypothetical protein